MATTAPGTPSFFAAVSTTVWSAAWSMRLRAGESGADPVVVVVCDSDVVDVVDEQPATTRAAHAARLAALTRCRPLRPISCSWKVADLEPSLCAQCVLGCGKKKVGG